MSRLVFLIPKGRAFCGRVVLIGSDKTILAGPFRALATASERVAKRHGNASASSLLPFGHAPTGSYVIVASLPSGYLHMKRSRRYGRVGALLLRARDGDALVASRNGRGLVAIHGGPRDKSRRLRPTRGGIRMTNAKLDALVRAINAAQLAGDPVESVDVIEVDTRVEKAGDHRGGRHARGLRRKKARGARRRKNEKRPTQKNSLPMFVLPLAALDGAKDRKVSRRDLMRTALVVAGAMAIEACDQPGRAYALEGCDRYYANPFVDDDDAGAIDGGGVDGGMDTGTSRGIHRTFHQPCYEDGYVQDPAGGVG